MLVKAVKHYYDKQKHRNIGRGEEINVSESRFQELRRTGLVEEKKKEPLKKKEE